MSIEAVAWALTVPLGGNLKVLLIGVANHAHADGTEAYPSLATLATYAHCDRSTARRNLRKLVADGWLVEDGEGPKKTVKYRVPVGVQNATPDRVGGVANGAGGGGIAVPPEPSKGTIPDSLRSSAKSARELAERSNDLGKLVLSALIDVAEAKRTDGFNPQSLVDACRKYRDRDLAAEADAFKFWYLEGNGQNVPVASLSGRWTTWLKRAPTKKVRAAAVKRPGRVDEARAERTRLDLEAIARLQAEEAA